VTTDWTYDHRDRVTSIIHKQTDGTVIASYAYDYGAAGTSDAEPHTITREDGSYVALTYDAALRLKTEEYHSAAAGHPTTQTITYDYDAAGDRTGKHVTVAGGTTSDYAYDVQQGYKLVGVTGPAGSGQDQSFGYDDGGRVTSIDRNGGSTTLGYNAAGQVTSVTGPANITYQYDGSGNRTSALVSGGGGGATTSYLVTPDGSTQLVSGAAGAVSAGFVYGPSGVAPLMKFDAGGTPQYYLEDAMGSVGAVVDGTQAAVARYAYDGFGNLLTGSAYPAAQVGSAAGGGC
jgi:YD repeat-containing protein